MRTITPAYTREELEPWSSDEAVRRAVDNLFCKGSVRDREAEQGFIGWIVNAQRPLVFIEGRLLYGANGTLFPSYGEAVAAVMSTIAAGVVHDRPLRIFGLNREVSA
jgi:hypothetical protein